MQKISLYSTLLCDDGINFGTDDLVVLSAGGFMGHLSKDSFLPSSRLLLRPSCDSLTLGPDKQSPFLFPSSSVDSFVPLNQI